MATVNYSADFPLLVVPPTAVTLDGFSEWTYSEDFPQQGKVTFVNGKILFDMSPERFESHVKIKTVITGVLAGLVDSEDLGEFYADGGRVKNVEGNISNEPDAMFASWKTLETGKLAPPTQPEQALDGKHIDLVGTPDWVCEVVSDSSVTKDKQTLREAYHQAGIAEYWLVDARGETIDFQLLVWNAEGYVAAPNNDDWHRSPVFDCEFQFSRKRNRVGNWQYALASR